MAPRDTLWRQVAAKVGRAFSARDDKALSARDKAMLLRSYYNTIGLYDTIADDKASTLKGLRNPVRNVVEFYVGKLFPGTLPEALPIETDNNAIKKPIEKIQRWSNWEQQKQVYARHLGIYGEAFIKVYTRTKTRSLSNSELEMDQKTGRIHEDVSREEPSGVSFNLINPEYVIEVESDDRGFLTKIRIDFPQPPTPPKFANPYTYTEVWSKKDQNLKIYRHTQGVGGSLKLLEPEQTKDFKVFGIDFIPIVQAKFQDVGDSRGISPFSPYLDGIDDANRAASRLKEIFFRYNRSVWALSRERGSRDLSDLPAPVIEGSSFLSEAMRSNPAGETELGDDTMVRLPSGASLNSMIPSVDYVAGQNIINADIQWFATQMPELNYYMLKDMPEFSGRAIRTILGPVIDRAIEARANAEHALVRANQMALSLGKVAKLEDFKELGEYDSGDLDHRFKVRPILPVDELEQAQTEQAQMLALQAKRDLLGLKEEVILKAAGYSRGDVDPALREQLRNGIGGTVPPAPTNGSTLRVAGTNGATNGNADPKAKAALMNGKGEPGGFG